MTIAQQRRQLTGRLFPTGPPRLCCPPLTHYRPDGSIDPQRIAAHLESLAPYVKALLAPGSTGDGWEMSPGEQRELLAVVLPHARRLGLQVLIGVLRTDASAVCESIRATLTWLRESSGADEDLSALLDSGVCGFTVCPPRGAGLSQDAIYAALASVLELGVPTVLYQLPQITENEMAPETVARLAAQFANFFMLKDTSGADRVALAGIDLGGVLLVRGAEGEYARWLRETGGPYDGFLLSTANCFAAQYHTMIEQIELGEFDAARQGIAPVERVVARAFEWVADEPRGNPFTNANKAIDHVLAYGPRALEVAPPTLHASGTLNLETIREANDVLAFEQLLPEMGYLGG
jgi:dihydrodipicolinate synthase/N-acetylneuraminate lyase